MLEKSKQPFLTAAKGRAAEHTPVWFMRQAGRSLPEYRKLRKKGTILDCLSDPALAAEITVQPVRRYGVDAAVLYSDIMVPLCALDEGIQIIEGKGPVVENPYRSAEDLKRLRPLEPEVDLAHTLDTIKILQGELEVPLIGFAGAPFTLASYLIEGGAAKNYAKIKTAMYGAVQSQGYQGSFFGQLMEVLADIVAKSLAAQIEAGVQAVQLFDSWAGALSPGDYEKYIMPHTEQIFSKLSKYDVPVIHFGVGTGELLALMAGSGASVMGVDWRVRLSAAKQKIAGQNQIKAVQGNLDPALCLAEWETVKQGVLEVLAEGAISQDAVPDQIPIQHIFNLGHGVLPETNPDILARIVDLVQES